jgi:TatD DNase family protein
VLQVLLPGVAAAQWRSLQALAQTSRQPYALGIHPLYVAPAQPSDLATLNACLQAHLDDPLLVAVGEIGLDFWSPGTDRAQQQFFYQAQLALARQYDLPVILHVRRSGDALLQGLRQTPVRGGIVHAFNGSLEQAQAFLAFGFKLGFGGAMTFERSLNIRRLAQQLPLSALVLETDAPDIPPQWLYRTAAQRAQGELARNEPAELPRMAQCLASIRGLSLSELAQATSFNVRQVLPRLPPSPSSPSLSA